jgi:hypothetical protein
VVITSRYCREVARRHRSGKAVADAKAADPRAATPILKAEDVDDLVTRRELPLGSRLDELLKEGIHLLILRCPFQ